MKELGALHDEPSETARADSANVVTQIGQPIRLELAQPLD